MARPTRAETVLASPLKFKSHKRLHPSVEIKQLAEMALNEAGCPRDQFVLMCTLDFVSRAPM